MDRNTPDRDEPRAEERSAGDRPSYATRVAETLIAALEKGTAPWQIPWESGQIDFMPNNPTTGKRYRGINALMLAAQGRSDPRWLTYNQAQDIGGQVRKGEKGTPVQYWKFTEQQDRRDEQGRLVIDQKTGKPFKDEVRLERPKVFFATVFNGEQIDNMPAMPEVKPPAWNPNERAEALLKASGAEIRHVPSDRAFYSPVPDFIQTPPPGQFSEPSKYYATAIHELGHWTGHSSRLDRDIGHPFGSEAYAREELRAEIASLIIGNELGLGHDPGQHAAYVKSWVSVLKDDPMEIFRAASDAEKITGYVAAFEQRQQQTQDNHQANAASVVANRSEKLSADPATAHQEAQEPVAVIIGQGAAQEPSTPLLRGDMVAVILPKNDIYRIGLYPDMRGIIPTPPDHLPVPGRVTGTLDNAVSVAALTEQGQLRNLITDPSNVHLASFQKNITSRIVSEPVPYLQYEFVGIDTAGRTAQLTADALRADVARQREARQANNPTATAEDFAAVRAERDDAETATRRETAASAARSQAEDNQAKTENQAVRDRQDGTASLSERTNITVPYAEKEEAKALGAKWDRQERTWYVPSGVPVEPFAKWVPAPTQAEQTPQGQAPAEGRGAAPAASVTSSTADGRTYLAVPYAERQEVKQRGAQWDKNAKCWFAPPGANLELFQRWKPENVRAQQSPPMPPKEEFGAVLRSIGFEVKGGHPFMDGKTHRCPLTTDKQGEQSGFYRAFLDGRPAAYAKNNRTGDEVRWKAQGYHLDDNQKAQLAAQAAENQKRRAEEMDRQQEDVAAKVTARLTELVTGKDMLAHGQTTPYLTKKGIKPTEGVYASGDTLVVPAMDVDGKVWTSQTIGGIPGDLSSKSFVKGGRKIGHFHPVGGMDALDAAPVLIIGEGYATMNSVSQGVGYATVAAFDAGNLLPVAKALAAKYPDKPVIIAGDTDDVGRTKAEEAAAAVNGATVFPIFQSQSPPGFGKPPTDFNDLANENEHGPAAVSRQVRAAVIHAGNRRHAPTPTTEQAREYTQDDAHARDQSRERGTSPDRNQGRDRSQSKDLASRRDQRDDAGRTVFRDDASRRQGRGQVQTHRVGRSR